MLLERFGLWEVRAERSPRTRAGWPSVSPSAGHSCTPELLVLDEPFTALDVDGAALLDRQLAELTGATTVLLTTHDPERVEPLATARLALA